MSKQNKVLMKFEDKNQDIQSLEIELTELGNGETAYICPLCSRLVKLNRGCASGHIAITPVSRPFHKKGGFAKTGLQRKHVMRLTDDEKKMIEIMRLSQKMKEFGGSALNP